MNKNLPSDVFEPIDQASRLATHWTSSAGLKLICAAIGTPIFIYSAEQIVRNARRVKDAAAAAGLAKRVSLYVPFFPNANPHVLAPLREEGIGILVQMPNEHDILVGHGFRDFIVSPGHVSNEEIAFWGAKQYRTFLASLDEVEFALREKAETISVRVDSLGCDKPGIKVGQLASLATMLKQYGRTLECFEVYCGSGNSLAGMVGIVKQIFQIYLDHFPDAQSINFAGGHGFDYEKWGEEEKHFDWRSYFESIAELATGMGIPERVRFLFEPARDILADAGVLITEIKRDVITNPNGSILVTDGTRMLMPSAQLRNRPHNTVFLDRNFNEIWDESFSRACKIRGRTILRNDYILPGEALVPRAVCRGDHLMIMDVGAYCATQHMEFLNVPPAGEVLVDVNGTAHLITEPGRQLDKWRNLLVEPRAILSAPPQADPESHQAKTY
ncbi:diaminopimelate decarboxylase [Aureimonas ureilytica]|uniref:diaminopimelate decarboxylase n=1 Tax=Aureimonas ureilytica TaxID=401562 RepID=UPI000A8431F6|nr:diaminopimelate decarboxylase [Aureimonas ureilytica]